MLAKLIFGAYLHELINELCIIFQSSINILWDLFNYLVINNTELSNLILKGNHIETWYNMWRVEKGVAVHGLYLCVVKCASDEYTTKIHVVVTYESQ